MSSRRDPPQRKEVIKRRDTSRIHGYQRRAWRGVAIEVGIGLFLWAGCVYMMTRLNWNFTTMVGGGALRTSGPAIPAWSAFALLGSLGLVAVVCGVIDMRRVLLKAQASPGQK